MSRSWMLLAKVIKMSLASRSFSKWVIYLIPTTLSHISLVSSKIGTIPAGALIIRYVMPDVHVNVPYRQIAVLAIEIPTSIKNALVSFF